MSKRILSLVLAMVMVLGTFGTMVFAETELDPKVQWLIDQELIQGDGSGNYDLDEAIQRSVLARIVALALEDEVAANALQAVPSGFADMTPAHWANGVAAYANAKGYMIGNEKNEFMPNGVVSYAEALVVLTKIALGSDLAPEEKAGSLTWFAPYVAKASELGITEGVSITNVGAPAVKNDILVMLYNVLNNKEYGNYTVLKAIVLENDRVETLKENEVVVEVIKAIQRADFVSASRSDDDLRGDQYNFVLSEKYDVENLLGKVADFSIDKNGKVVEIKVDDTYQYLAGKVVAINDALTVDGREYTVEKEERIDSADNRLFATYKNNEATTYRRFADARRFGDDDQTVVDFARVTTKNGKVVFIDAYDFSDIAPVKDVEKGLVVYNDVRDGGDKKVSEPSIIIGYNNGEFSRLEIEEVEELDVIHLYELGRSQFAIVRTDAVVNGEYEKVSFNRTREETLVVVDGEEYEALDVESKRPVVSYNENDVRTLDVKLADRDLRDFSKEDVTILIDVNSDLQYIGAEIEAAEFMALVYDVLARDVRVVRTSNDREDYRVTFGTRFIQEDDNKQLELNDFDRGDLAYVITDGEDLSVMAKFEGLISGNITKNTKGSQIINSNYLTVDGEEYRVLNRTNVFVEYPNGVLQGTTMKAVLDDLRTPDGDGLEVEILTDAEFEEHRISTYTRTTTTDRDDVAHTIVFKESPFKNATDTKIARLLRVYSTGRDYEIRVEYANGEREELKVVRNSLAWTALVNEDVVEEDVVALALTKADEPQVRDITSKISTDAGVFEVAEEVRHTDGAIVKLIDSNDVTQHYYIVGTNGFGELSRGAKVSISIANNRTIDIDTFIVRARSTRVDGVHGEVVGQEPGVETDGVVTYINGSDLMMGTKEYKIHAAAQQFFDRYVGVGDKIAFDLTDSGSIFKVTIYDGDITVANDDTFTDLVIGGDLTVNAGVTLTTKGITVKGDTIVNGTIVSNTTFEGDVTVNGTGTFTNVTFKSDLTVNGTATFKDKVTVSGEITGSEKIDTTDADEATKKLVEDTVESEKDAEISDALTAAKDALDVAETAIDNLAAEAEGKNFRSLQNIAVNALNEAVDAIDAYEKLVEEDDKELDKLSEKFRDLVEEINALEEERYNYDNLSNLTFKIKGIGNPQTEIAFDELNMVVAENAEDFLETLVELDKLDLDDEAKAEIITALEGVRFDVSKLEFVYVSGTEGNPGNYELKVNDGFLASGWEALKDERLGAESDTGYNVSVFVMERDSEVRYRITIPQVGAPTIAEF